ncbi:hypothetical protein D3C71_1634510 [compost metagenome]
MRAERPQVSAVAVFGSNHRSRPVAIGLALDDSASTAKEGGPGEGFGATLYWPARGTPTRIQRQADGSDRDVRPKFNMLHCRIGRPFAQWDWPESGTAFHKPPTAGLHPG